jgi:hypothetical protein
MIKPVITNEMLNLIINIELKRKNSYLHVRDE